MTLTTKLTTTPARGQSGIALLLPPSLKLTDVQDMASVLDATIKVVGYAPLTLRLVPRQERAA